MFSSFLVLFLLIKYSSCVDLVNTTGLHNNDTIRLTNDTKPIYNNTTEIPINNNNNNNTIEGLNGNNQFNQSAFDTTTTTTNSPAINTNKTMQHLVDRNKLVVVPGNQSDEAAFIGMNSRANSMNLPFTIIIIVIGCVFVVMVIIISSLFVMRRRFSKWRLNTNTNTVNIITSAEHKNSGGDNMSSTNDVLISKHDDHIGNGIHHMDNGISNDNCIENGGNVGNATGSAVATAVSCDGCCAHTNDVVPTNQSADSIKIENEINRVISEINNAVNHHGTIEMHVETAKLLNENKNQQQQQKPQIVDAEKQLLHKE